VNLSLSASSVGERIVVAMAVLGLIAELLSDNWKIEAEPIDPWACVVICEHQGTEVKRIESYACECAVDSPQPCTPRPSTF